MSGQNFVDKHLAGFDGLRGLSALIVVISHAHRFGLEAVTDKGTGAFGVMLFFAISGFLMAHLYLSQRFTVASVAGYVASRAVRIIPLYYAVLALSLIVSFFNLPQWPNQIDLMDLPRHLAFTGSISIFWSIGPEFQYYFFFIFVWFAFAMLAQGKTIWIWLMGLFSLACFLTIDMQPGIIFTSKLHIFLLGAIAVLFRPYVLKLKLGDGFHTAAQILALVCLAMLVFPPAPWRETLLPSIFKDERSLAYYGNLGFVLIIIYITFCFSLNTPFARVLMSNRVMRFLGDSCFSIYLMNVPVFYALDKLGITRSLPPGLGWAVALATIFLVSFMTFRYLENPARKAWRQPIKNLLLRVLAPRTAARQANSPLP